jgi:hypothetical protein
MKAINKILLVFLLSIGVASIFISCDKDDDDSGTPSIDYVRITRPQSSDSLLVGAGQGNLSQLSVKIYRMQLKFGSMTAKQY